jgi:PEP-CTERM motif
MMNSRLKNLIAAASAVICMGITSTAAHGALVYWTDWTGADLDPGVGFQGQGTITTGSTSLTVTYTNPKGVGFYQPSGGTDYYVGGATAATSPYTSAAVDNRPTGTDIIALQYAGTQTLHFSQAVANPVFAFVSLNGNGYAFDQDFELLSLGGVDGNGCGYWGCGGAIKVVVDLGGGHFEYQLNSNNVGGSEPHGALRFTGAFDTVTWRSSSNEYWNGFTVGVQGTAAEVFPPVPGVPEPETYALMLAGLGVLGVMARRRKGSAP